MSLNSLRARLKKLERQQQPESRAGPDWDALEYGDVPAFLASLDPPLHPSPEELEMRASRERLRQRCAEMGCTPADFGMPDPPVLAPLRSQSGFVEVPSPQQGDPS